MALAAEVEVEGRRLDSVKDALAGEIDRSGAYGIDGHRSAKAALMHIGRLPGPEADRRVRVARARRRHRNPHPPRRHPRHRRRLTAAPAVRDPLVVTDDTEEQKTVEFDEVIRRQRSRRSFRPDPVDRDVLDRVFRASQKAPSAGFSQGTCFLVLEGADAAFFWDTAFPLQPKADESRAPVVAIPLCNKQAYLDRYSEPDKQRLPVDLSDETNWPTPFWITDQSFASMIVLLACTNEGLASWYLGISTGWPEIAARFNVPAGFEELGAIAIGHHAGAESVAGSSKKRPRKPLEEHAVYGGWPTP